MIAQGLLAARDERGAHVLGQAGLARIDDPLLDHRRARVQALERLVEAGRRHRPHPAREIHRGAIEMRLAVAALEFDRGVEIAMRVVQPLLAERDGATQIRDVGIHHEPTRIVDRGLASRQGARG